MYPDVFWIFDYRRREMTPPPDVGAVPDQSPEIWLFTLVRCNIRDIVYVGVAGQLLLRHSFT